MSGRWRHETGDRRPEGGDRRPEGGDHRRDRTPPTAAERRELAERLMTAQDEAMRAEQQRRTHLEQVAEQWRNAQPPDLATGPRFGEECAEATSVRIPPLLLHGELLDPALPRNADRVRRFERLGYRLDDEDERWDDLTELIDVLRRVLPDATVVRLQEVDRSKTYDVLTGIVGPNGVVDILSTSWSVDPDDPTPTLLECDLTDPSASRPDAGGDGG